MKNREVFQRDPAIATLPNDGVVAVIEGRTEKEQAALRFELEHFVCEGQYHKGLVRILDSYISHVGASTQPAAWVSGFYGSGKSHLLKILQHLWGNSTIDANGTKARDLAQLPADITAALKELDTFGRRCGGLHAVGGTLPSGGGISPRLAVLGMLFQSLGLPESLPQAQFCLWLQEDGLYDQVRSAVDTAVADKGKDFFDELRHLYVSPVIARALLDANSDLAPDLSSVSGLLKEQFPKREDITTSEFIQTVRDTLESDGNLPATAIVLDEIQLYIGDSSTRSTDVQEMAEALCKQLDSRVLLIGAGQTALAANIPLLQRLKDRFTVSVELSDTDVETVTRKVILAKKADKRKPIEEILEANAGEIARHLAGTAIETRSEDRQTIVDDYPLLPGRRRFWEHALRAVDIPGTASQLRTQLRMVHEAVHETADESLGTVIPADFLFEQQRPGLLQSGFLLKEIDETIQNLDDGTAEGRLAKRICELVFLIRKLPRDEGADIGVRATPEILADLLVRDLAKGGLALRRDVPQILARLVENGTLIQVDNEYSLQTRESSEWDREFRNQQTRINSNLTGLASMRSQLLRSAVGEVLKGVRPLHGESKVPRTLRVHFGADPMEVDGAEIPVWIRDGWGESENTVVNEARAAGSGSPTIFVFIPKASADDLQKAMVACAAAEATINMKGTPTTEPGREARGAMASRRSATESTRDQIVRELVDRARVLQGGGNEQFEASFVAKVGAAAQASLDRLFPQFREADNNRWPRVIGRAKNGDEAALQAIDWDGPVDQHPICSAVLREIGAGKKGRDIRNAFKRAPYGWAQDAIDAALLVLHTAGQIRATHKGVAVPRKELDQNKIPVTDFRTETITLTTKALMRLRKLFQDSGIECAPNQESEKAAEYLAHLSELATRAGGEAPLPEAPATKHLDDLKGLGGNEKLQAIQIQSEELGKQAAEWARLAALAEERLPAWSNLIRLLHHADGLNGVDQLEDQADAIRSERRLPEATDPVPPLLKAVEGMLRSAVAEAQQTYHTTYAVQLEALEATEAWTQLPEEERTQILDGESIQPAAPVRIDGGDALLAALEATPLGIWRTKSAALPQLFRQAALAAEKKLEPTVREIQLPRRTLKSESDVKEWVSEAERELLDKVKDGPIVIS